MGSALAAPPSRMVRALSAPPPRLARTLSAPPLRATCQAAVRAAVTALSPGCAAPPPATPPSATPPPTAPPAVHPPLSEAEMETVFEATLQVALYPFNDLPLPLTLP